nr:PQQ-binding-like beta-propeller repeat protein [Shimia biformata]
MTATAILVGCGDKEVILPGKREELRPNQSAEIVNQDRAISLPGQVKNAEWTHRIGTPKYRTRNAALSARPTLAWSASIGKGEGKRNRIVADPVVAGGRIFTMDSESTVTATSPSGQTLWQKSLVPVRDKPSESAGGGIAFGNGKLYVASGFGHLKALDPATGNEIWEQRLQAVGSGSPTIYGDKVYIVAGNDTAWAINAETGKTEWQLGSVPNIAGLHSASAPAVDDRLAIFAFGSGELQAAFRRGGVRLWDAGVQGQRVGYASGTVGDVSGDPVIDGRRVYAANYSGRTVALNIDTGERLWTANEGAISPVWPAGGSVFLVSDRNHLIRLDAGSGEPIWSVELPLFKKDKPRKQAAVYAHFGPVLAGSQIIVASSDGLLRVFDPRSGALVHSVEIPGGAATGMAVAGGTLYVVGSNGQLHAFR